MKVKDSHKRYLLCLIIFFFYYLLFDFYIIISFTPAKIGNAPTICKDKAIKVFNKEKS